MVSGNELMSTFLGFVCMANAVRNAWIGITSNIYIAPAIVQG